LLSCTLISLLAASRPALAGQEVNLCEANDFAPFVFPSPGRPGVLQGATVELVSQMFQRAHIAYRIRLMPWARCLASVQQGSDQIGMDADYLPASAQQLTYSKPYYTLTPQYFYSRRRFPKGMAISASADLKKYSGCGIFGYSYQHYGLSNHDLDTSSRNRDSLMRKLEFGRCEYFVEDLEVMRAEALTGHSASNNPDLAHGPVPDATPPELHFILTKSSVQTATLLTLINQEITIARQDHRMEQWVNRILNQQQHRPET
jgi:polar amino acid transport system substrate-binding protein